MKVEALVRVIVSAVEDVKAQDIKVFNTSALTDLFDRVVVASGTSNRQTRALADRVRQAVREKGVEVIAVEGEETGEWVLVDAGDIVVHVMLPAVRDYYDIEALWGGEKPSFSPNAARPWSAL